MPRLSVQSLPLLDMIHHFEALERVLSRINMIVPWLGCMEGYLML